MTWLWFVIGVFIGIIIGGLAVEANKARDKDTLREAVDGILEWMKNNDQMIRMIMELKGIEDADKEQQAAVAKHDPWRWN